MKQLAPESHDNSTMMVIRVVMDSIVVDEIVENDCRRIEFLMESMMGARQVSLKYGDME